MTGYVTEKLGREDSGRNMEPTPGPAWPPPLAGHIPFFIIRKGDLSGHRRFSLSNKDSDTKGGGQAAGSMLHPVTVSQSQLWCETCLRKATLSGGPKRAASHSG